MFELLINNKFCQHIINKITNDFSSIIIDTEDDNSIVIINKLRSATQTYIRIYLIENHTAISTHGIEWLADQFVKCYSINSVQCVGDAFFFKEHQIVSLPPSDIIQIFELTKETPISDLLKYEVDLIIGNY